MKKTLTTIIATTLLTFTSLATTPEQAQRKLLQGVNLINSGGAPGVVLCGGEHAFPLIAASCNNTTLPVAAAAYYGKGRVIALGHPDFLSADAMTKGDTATFMRNAINWLGAAPTTVAVYKNKGFATALQQLDLFTVKEINSLKDLSPGIKLLIGNPDEMPAAELQLATDFIQQGGGLLTTGIGWGWQQVNSGKSLTYDNHFNRLLSPAGLLISGDFAGRTAKDGYLANQPLDPALNIATATELATAPNLPRERQRLVSAVLLAARSVLPPDSPLPLAQKIATLSQGPLANKLPSEKQPLTTADIPARLALLDHQNNWLSNPATTCQPHPAAAVYPGLPPADAPRIARSLTISLARPRWHSTGLYAAAGEPISVELPPDAEKLGLKLRIGSTTCNNTRHDKWSRAPRVDVEIPLKEQRTTVASPFGGLLYIVVPETPPKSATPLLKVKLATACPAPWFKLGRDTPANWRKKIRSLPAPWAELESDKVILTIPADLVRDMADPTPILNYWDHVADLDAKLTGLPPERRSPERFVADVQLCAGWMHAGYPIMIPTSTAKDTIDLDTLKTKGDWGLFHELGHNHQNYDWVFNGTVEVSVNFFTLYNLEKICNIKPRQTRMRDDGGERISQQVQRWVADGKSYEKWCNEPFLALEAFVRIQQCYGWEVFEKLFAEYRTLSKAERPSNDLEKRDQWVTRLSRITGHNMSTIFDAWNIPISEDARKICAEFPRPPHQTLFKDL